MPEYKGKVESKNVEGVMSDNHYPSSVDNMVRNDTPFEGSENQMPEVNPIPGADGSIPVHSIKKTS